MYRSAIANYQKRSKSACACMAKHGVWISDDEVARSPRYKKMRSEGATKQSSAVSKKLKQTKHSVQTQASFIDSTKSFHRRNMPPSGENLDESTSSESTLIASHQFAGTSNEDVSVAQFGPPSRMESYGERRDRIQTYSDADHTDNEENERPVMIFERRRDFVARLADSEMCFETTQASLCGTSSTAFVREQGVQCNSEITEDLGNDVQYEPASYMALPSIGRNRAKAFGPRRSVRTSMPSDDLSVTHSESSADISSQGKFCKYGNATAETSQTSLSDATGGTTVTASVVGRSMYYDCEVIESHQKSADMLSNQSNLTTEDMCGTESAPASAVEASSESRYRAHAFAPRTSTVPEEPEETQEAYNKTKLQAIKVNDKSVQEPSKIHTDFKDDGSGPNIIKSIEKPLKVEKEAEKEDAEALHRITTKPSCFTLNNLVLLLLTLLVAWAIFGQHGAPN